MLVNWLSTSSYIASKPFGRKPTLSLVGKKPFWSRQHWSSRVAGAAERCLHTADYLGFKNENTQQYAEHIQQLFPCEAEEGQRRQFSFVLDALVAVDLKRRLDDVADTFSKSKEEPPQKVRK